jgi:hypothetical protein
MSIYTMIGWLYGQCIKLYPRDFRAEFGDEMRAVFAKTTADRPGVGAMQLFLRELRDLPLALWQARFAKGLGGVNMSAQSEYMCPSTRWEALLGALPFLAFGVSRMIGEVDSWAIRGIDAEMAVYALTLVGLLIGWVRGFPLWSYGYLGWSLVLATLYTNVSVGGVRWGYRVWIPFAVTVLLAIAWTRSLDPIRKLLRDIWNNWTRLSLATFALGAMIWLFYDENHHPYLLLFMLASTLAVAGGVWFFLRSSTLGGRIGSIAGSYVAAAVVGGTSYATWDWRANSGWRAYYGYPQAQAGTWHEFLGVLIMNTAWLIFLFWPATIAVVRRIVQKRQAA